MHDYSLFIGSSTRAMKAKRALERKGIRALLRKDLPHDDDGCRYALQIDAKDFMTATMILRELGIPYRGKG